MVDGHVCSMPVADSSKVLVKPSALTKIAIASQGKNNISETSITILSWYDSSDFLHCGKIGSTSVAPFD